MVLYMYMDNSMKQEGAGLQAVVPKHKHRTVYIIIIILVVIIGGWWYVSNQQVVGGPMSDEMKQQIVNSVQSDSSGSTISDVAKDSITNTVIKENTGKNGLTEEQKQAIINNINGQPAIQ